MRTRISGEDYARALANDPEWLDRYPSPTHFCAKRPNRTAWRDQAALPYKLKNYVQSRHSPASSRIKSLGLEGIVSKKLDAPYGAIKGVAEKSKIRMHLRNSGNRWDLLINASLAMAAVALTRHSLANGISDAKSERTTDQQRNHNVRHARLSLGCSRRCLSN